MMLSLEAVNEFVYENFEGVKLSQNGTHFTCRCALCGDSKKSLAKKRMNIDYNNGNPIWHCFNCGRSGSFLELYSIIKGLSIDESKKALFDYNPDYLTQKLSNRKRKKIVDEIEHEYHDYITADCLSEKDKISGIQEKNYQKALKEFREERKIPKDVKLFVAYKGKYQGRVIIPIYDENRHITYFQARTIVKGIDPKYKNPSLTKGDIILNRNLFDREKYIIVFEGLIDAFMVGNQGTACLGASITDSFVKEILNLTEKGIIIAFDNDDPGRKALKKFMKGDRKNPPNSYNKKVKYFIFPKKYDDCSDINKCVLKYDIKNVYDFILKNSYSYEKAYFMLSMSNGGK